MNTKIILFVLLFALLNLLSCSNSNVGRIYGTIYRSDNGNPISGAVVRLGNHNLASNLRQGETAIVAQTETKFDGTYEFPKLETGKYYLVIFIPKTSLPCNLHEGDFITADDFEEFPNSEKSGMAIIASPIERAKNLVFNQSLKWDVPIICISIQNISSPKTDKLSKQLSNGNLNISDTIEKIGIYLDSLLKTNPGNSLIGRDLTKIMELYLYIETIKDQKPLSPIEKEKIENAEIMLSTLARKVVPRSEWEK